MVINMKPDIYYNKYIRDGLYSFAVNANKFSHILKQLCEKRVLEVKDHPPFDKVESYEIVSCGKIWVLLGKVLCNFIDGEKLINFEIAIGINEAELNIWKDLHIV